MLFGALFINRFTTIAKKAGLLVGNSRWRVSVHPSVNVEIDVCMLTQFHCNLRFIQLRVHAHCAIVAKVQ